MPSSTAGSPSRKMMAIANFTVASEVDCFHVAIGSRSRESSGPSSMFLRTRHRSDQGWNDHGIEKRHDATDRPRLGAKQRS